MKQRDVHETYKVAAGNLHWAIIVLLATLLAIVLLMYWLAKPLMRSATQIQIPALPPTPRLQPYPARDLAASRKREQAKLDGYVWIDKKNGIARIPIDRAMQLLVQQKSSR